jgi:Tfp pilus assembly protein FimT
MALPRASVREEVGLTLVEIIVVIALFLILAGLSLLFSMDFYRTHAFHAEKNTVISILAKARNQAMANYHQTTHGVCYDDGEYVLFEGAGPCAGAAVQQRFQKNYAVTVIWPTEIVFQQLDGNPAGDCSSACVINLFDNNGHSATLSVNNEGRINW